MWRRDLLRYTPHFIIGIWFIWVLGVLATGAGLNVFGSKAFDFEVPAKFGDAFGSLGGLMASLAAAGAWYAVSLQRQDLERQDSVRAADDMERRQQAFEQNFFQLLGHLASLVRETDIISTNFLSGTRTTERHTGKDAFRRILRVLRHHMARKKDEHSPEETYARFYALYEDDLGHYFRVLYHLCNYVYSNKNIDRHFYLKFVFGQLSNSEQILVAYNCAFGRGRNKFKPIVEEFCCLTNIGFDQENQFEESLLRQKISADALPLASVKSNSDQ